MGLRISGDSFFTKRYLDVHSNGVTFMESSAFGGARNFSFAQIEVVLMSPANVLSLQVGREIFSIPTKPAKKKHQEVIRALVLEVKRNAPAGAGVGQ